MVMSDSTAVIILLSMLALVVFSVLFYVSWFKISRKILQRSFKDIAIKFILMTFIPFMMFVIVFKDVKAIIDLRRHIGDFENQIQVNINSSNQCRAEITELEAEIQQLTMQANALK
jgi:septal ring factor EnvC (AmiA/AmiB activator)